MPSIQKKSLQYEVISGFYEQSKRKINKIRSRAAHEKAKQAIVC